METILNGRLDVFRTIVAAVAKHKDLQLVLSVGDQVDPEQIGRVANNAIIVKQATMILSDEKLQDMVGINPQKLADQRDTVLGV